MVIAYWRPLGTLDGSTISFHHEPRFFVPSTLDSSTDAQTQDTLDRRCRQLCDVRLRRSLDWTSIPGKRCRFGDPRGSESKSLHHRPQGGRPLGPSLPVHDPRWPAFAAASDLAIRVHPKDRGSDRTALHKAHGPKRYGSARVGLEPSLATGPDRCDSLRGFVHHRPDTRCACRMPPPAGNRLGWAICMVSASRRLDLQRDRLPGFDRGPRR